MEVMMRYQISDTSSKAMDTTSITINHAAEDLRTLFEPILNCCLSLDGIETRAVNRNSAICARLSSESVFISIEQAARTETFRRDNVKGIE